MPRGGAATATVGGDGPPLFFALPGCLGVRVALCRVVIPARSAASTRAQMPQPSPVDVEAQRVADD
eukprot:8385083-Pyramimonas_sp.AAC.1